MLRAGPSYSISCCTALTGQEISGVPSELNSPDIFDDMDRMPKRKKGRRNKHNNRNVRKSRRRPTANDGGEFCNDGKHDNEKDEDVPLMDDIEAQLEIQRRSRQLRNKQSDHAVSSPKRRTMGNLEYDPSRKAYFPKGSFPKGIKEIRSSEDPSELCNTLQRLQQHKRCDNNKLVHVPSSLFGIAIQSTPVSQYRQHLAHLWGGRLLAHRMELVPCAIRRYDPVQKMEPTGWKSLLLRSALSPDPSSRTNFAQHIPLDLHSKSNLHPAIPTFDIRQSKFNPEHFPSIMTESGHRIMIQHFHDPVSCAVSYIGEDSPLEGPMSFVGRDDALHAFGLISVGIGSTPMAVWNDIMPRYPTPHFCCVTRHPVNNVCSRPSFGNSSEAYIAFAPEACPPTAVASKYDLVWNLADMSSGPITSLWRRHLQSSALCVEFLFDNPNLLLLGHQNGTVTLFDIRQRSSLTHVFIPASKGGQEKGAIHAIRSLSSRPSHEVIFQQSFGHVGISDLRMTISPDDTVSSNAANIHCNSHEMESIPEEKLRVNPTLSMCCAGLATDPSESVLISPVVDERRQTHLAFWSIPARRFLTSKQIAPASQGNRASLLPHCELNRNITYAWDYAPSSSTGEQEFCLNNAKRKDGWGLWFKSGCIEQSSPKRFGSISHLTFPSNTTLDGDSLMGRYCWG